MVEQEAVDFEVVSSSLTGGAIFLPNFLVNNYLVIDFFVENAYTYGI